MEGTRTGEHSEAKTPEREAQVFGLLLQAAAHITDERDEMGLGEGLVDAIRQLGAASADLYLMDEVRQELRLVVQRGEQLLRPERAEVVPLDAPLLTAHCARTRQMYLVDGQEHSLPLPQRGWQLASSLVAVTGAVPLVAHGRLRGVLVWSPAKPLRYTPLELMIIEAIATTFACGFASLELEREQRRLEKALHRVERATDQLERLAPLGHWEWRPASGAMRWSDGFHRILGTRPEERVSGATYPAFLERVHLDDRGRVAEVMEGIAARGGSCQLEHRVVGFDGVERVVLEQLDLVHNSDDEPPSVFASAHDLTSRRRVEEALRQSEERFRLSIDNAPIGMALVALDGHFIRVNQALCEIVGYAPEELMQLRFQDITHPDDLQTDLQLAQQLWAGQIPRYQLVKRYVHKDGSIVKIRLHGSAVRALDGRPIHAVAQIEDITAAERHHEERERLLAELDTKHQLLQTFVERSPAATALIGPDGQWLLASPQVERLVGHSLASSTSSFELQSQTLRSDGTPLPVDEFPSVRTLRGEQLAGEEYLLERGGRRVPIVIRSAPVRDAAGRIVAAAVVAEDVSAFKELERLREEWISVIAHDLRQPVMTILYAAQILARSVGEGGRGSCERIQTNARQLDRMIRDLLDVSRIEAHRLTLERKAVDLAGLADELVHTLTELAERAVRLEAPPSLPAVWGDPGRLKQVLGNLLSNAAKYSTPGSAIEVQLGQREKGVEITVTNQGRGIPPEELSRLFSRFGRTSASRKAGIPGLGLGLYISKGLVEAHDGRIWAESTPGKTTSFHVVLPLARSHLAA